MTEPQGHDHASLGASLLERRVVRLWGPLDDRSVGQVAAELMTLDAIGDGPVQLMLASEGGPLHLALSLADTIDLLGAPVHVTCLGRVEGSAVLVAAVATKRASAPHAQFRLCAPEVSATGNATQLAVWAEQHQAELDSFSERLAQACRRHREHLEADLAAGLWLDAEGALRYGLVDEIWASPPGPGMSRRPLGFGPPVPPDYRPEG